MSVIPSPIPTGHGAAYDALFLDGSHDDLLTRLDIPDERLTDEGKIPDDVLRAFEIGFSLGFEARGKIS